MQLKKKTKEIIGFIVVLVITILILYFSLKDNFKEKINCLLSFNKFWFLIGMLLTLAYFALKALAIFNCCLKFKKDYHYKESFKLMLDIQFVNSITPFNMGGQPYQLYTLKKQGFSLDKGTSIAIEDYLAYQIALVLVAFLSLLFNLIFHFLPNDKILTKLVILGFVFNIFIILVLLYLAFNTKGNKKILKIIGNICYKLRIIKNKKEFIDSIDDKIKNFHDGAMLLIKDKKLLIKIVSINILALILLYLVPFALIKGLNLYVNPFICISATANVMLMATFVPIPGGTGGLEYGFLRFYGYFIKGSKLTAIMIAWRFLTYYFGMILGGITIGKR